MIGASDDINELVGEQTCPTNYDPESLSVYFFECLPKGGNAFSKQLELSMRRVLVKTVKSYSSVDEILSDESLLQPNTENYDVQTLNRHIASDSNRGFGKLYKNGTLLAYSGKAPMDRPIAKMVYPDGSIKYYVSPNFDKLVKRV